MDAFLIFVAPFLVILTGIVLSFWWVLKDDVVRKED
ncbi:cytochrome bd oxidase small subunit CydS [Ornithinibacillus halotolerans]